MRPGATQPDGARPPSDAAEWDARLRSPLCTDGDREAFARWCNDSPANARSIEDLQSRIRALKHAASVDPRLRAVIDRADAQAKERSHAWMKRVAIFVGVIGLGGGVLMTSSRLIWPRTIDYQTMVGERSTIQLEDGSVVVLNSRSELAVQYGLRTRALTLKSGEAMFTVAHERRPFVVTVGAQQVVAVGTAFDIRTTSRQLEVTMVRGKVKVRPADENVSGGAHLSLVAGQRMVADYAQRRIIVKASDARAETAWMDGRVQFEDTPLADAVEEINRYSTHRITVADAGLQTVVINGSFRTAHPDNFVTAITSYYPIDAQVAANGDVKLVRR